MLYVYIYGRYIMQPWVWGRMRLYGVQGTQSVRADDEPETRPIIGEEGSTLRLTTTERRLKPRTSPESQPRLGFTDASKKILPIEFFFSSALSDSTEALACCEARRSSDSRCPVPATITIHPLKTVPQ